MATSKPKKLAPKEPKKTRTLSLTDAAWTRAGVHALMTGKSISAMVEAWFLTFPVYSQVPPKSSKS